MVVTRLVPRFDRPSRKPLRLAAYWLPQLFHTVAMRYFNSNVMMVMMIAITPSLNASNLPFGHLVLQAHPNGTASLKAFLFKSQPCPLRVSGEVE